jgi:hypothetical protein
MKRNKHLIVGTAFAIMAGCMVSGCTGKDGSAPNGTPSQGFTVKPTDAQIAEVQNNPNIPADKKAGIIAMMGKRVTQPQCPPASRPSSLRCASAHIALRPQSPAQIFIDRA